MTGMPTLREDENYYFDEAAAEKIVRFFERHLKHFSGEHAGDPFKLEDVQKDILRSVFGWKHKRGEKAGKRRFTDVYWESAIGSGKSPVLAGVGLFGLIADGQIGAEVYSLASTYPQAKIVFGCGKKFAGANPALEARLDIVEREIRYHPANAVWTIVSGKGPGAGAKPTLVLVDEGHDIRASTAYDDLDSRKSKTPEPMTWVATNTPKSEASFCWKLRERAVAALKGEGDPALFPIIWCADQNARTDDPIAWRASNPLLGVTVKESSVAAKCVEAMKDPEDEAKFRRLYLGIIPTVGKGGFFNLALWDKATSIPFNASNLPAKTPTYVGLDMSQGNDLCSAVFVWPTVDRFFVGVKFWAAREIAEKWQRTHGYPYSEWERAGAITLLDGPTITKAHQKQIADEIASMGKVYPIHATYYDAAYASRVIAHLEAAKIRCVPMAQNYTISPGLSELDRRLKEESISIVANPVMRWNAENASVRIDHKGNHILQKPHADGTYAGDRGAKVDSIAALITVLTEARKHDFPAAKPAQPNVRTA